MLVRLAPPDRVWDVPDLAEVEPYVPDVVPPAWVLVDQPLLWEVPSCACTTEAEPLVDEIVGWAIPRVTSAGAVGEPAAVGDLVARIAAAVAELTGVQPVSLPGPVALAEEKALLAVQQVLRVDQLGRVADLNRRKLYQLESFGSLSSWLTVQPGDLDTRDVALGKKLHKYPVVRRGLTRLQLSLAGATRLGTALDKLSRVVDRPDGQIDGQAGAEVLAGVLPHVAVLVSRCRLGMAADDPLLLALVDQLSVISGSGDTQLGQLESAFVLLAQQVEPTLLKGCLAELLGAILPNTLEDKATKADDERGLDLLLSYDGSGGRLVADLTPETAELLHLLLDAELRRDPANPTDTAAGVAHRAAGGDDTGLVLDRRSSRQRRQDAFRNGLQRYLAADLAGVHHKAPVRLSVTCGIELLAAAPGALPATSRSGQLLPGSLLSRWMCEHAAVRYVMTLGRKVLETSQTSHTGRTLTAAERQALDVQSGQQCAAAGHDHGTQTPGLVLEPHHVRRFTDDGRTSFTQTYWACPGLHHDLHTGKKTVLLKDGTRINENGWVAAPTQRE